MGRYKEGRAPSGNPADGERDAWFDSGELKFGHYVASNDTWAVDRSLGYLDIGALASDGDGKKVALNSGKLEFLTYNETTSDWDITKVVDNDGTYTAPVADTHHTVGASGEPAYQNGWYGASYIQFIKLGTTVYLSGCADGGSENTVMFTLPTGYRPSVQKMYTRPNIVGETNIKVNTDGTVYVDEAGLSGDASFSGGFSFTV
jgi:hypothetical protein